MDRVTPSMSLQSGLTPSSLAAALTVSINSSCSSMGQLVASGPAVLLSSTTQGSAEDYAITPTWEGMLPYNSFALTTSGPTMIGGTANYATATINVTGTENALGTITASANYDLAGNMTSLTYPDGRVVQRTVDSANRLNGVSYSRTRDRSIPHQRFRPCSESQQSGLLGSGINADVVFQQSPEQF